MGAVGKLCGRRLRDKAYIIPVAERDGQFDQTCVQTHSGPVKRFLGEGCPIGSIHSAEWTNAVMADSKPFLRLRYSTGDRVVALGRCQVAAERATAEAPVGARPSED
jgi:hypothetical protein